MLKLLGFVALVVIIAAVIMSPRETGKVAGEVYRGAADLAGSAYEGAVEGAKEAKGGTK